MKRTIIRTARWVALGLALPLGAGGLLAAPHTHAGSTGTGIAEFDVPGQVAALDPTQAAQAADPEPALQAADDISRDEAGNDGTELTLKRRHHRGGIHVPRPRTHKHRRRH